MVASRFDGGGKLIAGFVRCNIDLNQPADEKTAQPQQIRYEHDMLQFCEFFAAEICPLERPAFT
jgi:hypothetical protein